MKKNQLFSILIISVILCTNYPLFAQFDLEGDFRFRYYSDSFDKALDNRDTENYMRYLARIRAKMTVNPNTSFYTEFITFTDNNPLSSVRNIAGTGKTYFGISQLFAEILRPNFLFFDLARLRVGRQQFPIGQGLSMGESYYFVDKFDGGRLDLSYRLFNLSLFGAITGQNVSESGLYPDPGSDQIYVARLSRRVFQHDLMGYYIYQKPRGDFNDSYIVGAGINAEKLNGRLTYFAEGAYQKFNTLSGLPEKGGIGYMGGIGYRTSLGVFRSIKVETRYAAYQGDDASTGEVEQFSPLYPSLFWGDRYGWVNGEIGGVYPYKGRNPEGTRIWYSRIYFIPKWLPSLRLQIQYLDISEYVDNDNYNTMNDEYSIRLYFRLSPQTQLNFRFSQSLTNGGDKDLNQSGLLSWSEDRVNLTRFLCEFRVKF